MGTKIVQVASTNSRLFVEAVMELAKKGAYLPKDQGVFKGVILTTRLEIDEGELVEESAVVKVFPKPREKTDKTKESFAVSKKEEKVEEKDETEEATQDIIEDTVDSQEEKPKKKTAKRKKKKE